MLHRSILWLLPVLLVVVVGVQACWKVDKTINNIIPSVKREPICYHGLGCFPIFEKSNEMLKLLSMAFMHSDAPEEIDVRLNVFDCPNPYKAIQLRYNATEESIRQTNYAGNKQTVVIIHGFRDTYHEMNWNAVSCIH